MSSTFENGTATASTGAVTEDVLSTATGTDEGKVFEKLTRNYSITQTFIEHQKVADQLQRTTDVNLICSDGIIPVHAAILQAVSPFFDVIFSTYLRGLHNVGMCPVLLPDYTVADFSKIVELIYYGTTNIASVEEAEEVTIMLSYFDIRFAPIKLFPKVEDSSSEETLSALPLLTFPLATVSAPVKLEITNVEPEINNVEPEIKNAVPEIKNAEPVPVATSASNETNDQAEAGDATSQTPIENEPPKSAEKASTSSVCLKNLRPRETLKKTVTKEPSDSESDSDFTDFDVAQCRRRRTALKKGIGKKPAIPVSTTCTTSSTAAASSTNQPAPVEPSVDNATTTKANKPAKSDRPKNASDTSDEEVDANIYSDMDWFLKESKRCQHCGEKSKTAAAASICLTNHGKLRCYYCFKVVRNTEKLFEHFSKKHKQAGRDSCLMCPFCEQAIPYKSVSCHVISMHLQNAIKTGSGGNSKPGRPLGSGCASATTSTPENNGNVEEPEPESSASASKKRKTEASGSETDEPEVNDLSNINVSGNPQVEDDRLMVRDLNFVIRRHSICPGKIRVFTLKKKRSLVPTLDI